jgi:hypothetical protein
MSASVSSLFAAASAKKKKEKKEESIEAPGSKAGRKRRSRKRWSNDSRDVSSWVGQIGSAPLCPKGDRINKERAFCSAWSLTAVMLLAVQLHTSFFCIYMYIYLYTHTYIYIYR